MNDSSDVEKIAAQLEILLGGSPHHNIHAINQFPEAMKKRVYSSLIPERIFSEFRIDRQTFLNEQGERAVKFISPSKAGFAIIEVRENPDDRDCIFFLEVADTSFFQFEITFLIVNDPTAPRFNTDIDNAGRRTKFGTARRNLDEELKAMRAGLAPGQVRRGLRLLKDFIPIILGFATAMGRDMIVAEPLAYHDAIIFEHYGFNYILGKKKMIEIDRGFRPGGTLHRKLDGSTPFRTPGAEQTVRGRSWAIHDGVMEEPWKDIEMYLSVNHPQDVCTFPGWVY
jgi:hypothetical protein